LIGAKIISAENLTVIFGDEDLIASRKPVGKRFIAIDTRGSVYVSPARKTGSRIRQMLSASAVFAGRMLNISDYLAAGRTGSDQSRETP